MRTLVAVSLAFLAAGAAFAAPRVWLEGTDVPEALMASNDSGKEIAGCKVEWTLTYADGSHYTEIAMADLPANGSVKVNDCREWWDERRTKTLHVSLTLYGPDAAVLASHTSDLKLVARQGLPTDGWSATASRGGNAAAAFDGDPATRWDTGRTQQAGDWYLLDMSRPQRFAGLIVDTRWSANDYPAALTVSVSEDNAKWTIVADIADTEPLNKQGKITLRFDPVTARYIKLVLTKPHGENWYWSIHELSVLPPEAK